ncbi:MAG: hypothetical protein IR153_00255 [Flavobacterium sp.]|nr:hypothetical protein [Flavobacterium sp.]
MREFEIWEIVVLVVFISTFILGSLGTARYLIRRRKNKAKAKLDQEQNNTLS